MFRPTAFAVAGALFGSLILNLTLKPVLGSYLLSEKNLRDRRSPLTEFFERIYRGALEVALRNKRIILVLFLVLILATGILYNFLGKEFVPALDEGAIMASTVMLPETSLEESMAMGRRIEEIFLSFPEVVSPTS